MRVLIAVLVVILLVLQYKLWMGKGGYLDARKLEQELFQQREKNAELIARNRMLQAEVEDLKKGLAAIEERAREELGMIQEGETFFQIVPPPQTNQTEQSNP